MKLMTTLRNKIIIELMCVLAVILLIIVFITSIIKIDESKKINCINNGGYVEEDYIGLYNGCIYRG